jgi:hypothetical protein
LPMFACLCATAPKRGYAAHMLYTLPGRSLQLRPDLCQIRPLALSLFDPQNFLSCIHVNR